MLVDVLLAAALLPAHQPAAPAPREFQGPSGRVSISSGWRYRADPAARGTALGWTRGRFGGTTVGLPHSGNPQSTAAGASLDAAQRAFRGTVGWYSRTITVPSTGRYALGFSSAHAYADVFVDGRQVGERHAGAFLPFEVAPRLTRGTHRVVVRVDWRSPAALTRDAQARTWFNYGGLNGEATLRRVGTTDVRDATLRTTVAPDRSSATVEVAARVTNRTASSRPIAPFGRLTREGVDLPLAFSAQTVPAGATRTFRATLAVPSPALWTPESPSLYELAVGTGADAGYRARVGLRELSWPDGRLLLNGQPLVLRGASFHEDVRGRGDALRPGDEEEVVREVRALGANALRVQHALTPSLMERLDAAGIMVTQQTGPVDSPAKFTLTTPRLRAKASAQVQAAVRAGALHPSLIGWSLGTEVSGNGRPGQGAFVQRQARYLHEADPGRMVGVDVWKELLPSEPGAMYADLDFVGTTSYFGWYERTDATPEEALAALRRRLDLFRTRMPGKVLVASELGAEGTPDNPTSRPGGLRYQADLLGAQLRGLATEEGLSGAYVWILRDFAVNPAFGGGSIVQKVPGIRLPRGFNQKGLFTIDGRPKPSAQAATEAFAQFPRPAGG